MAPHRARLLRTFMVVLAVYMLAFTTLLTAVSVLYPEPFRRAEPFPDSFYSIDFWNLSHVEDDLRFRPVGTEVVGDVVVEEGFFLSEVYGGVEVWVHCGIIRPRDVSGKLPALVFMHGYGGRWEDFEPFLVEVVRSGFVVVALSAPGASGKSSPFPSDSPENILNVSDGPQYGYFYHVAYALMRGVTLARNLSFVDPSLVGVGGASMGGIASLIVAAVDDRVSYAVVIVAAGNYLDSVLSGSLANGLSPDIPLHSDASIKFLKYFDVYAYASRISKPVLYITATNDEFFTVVSYNDTLSRLGNVTHVLYPNSNHFGKGWSSKAVKTVVSWLLTHVKRAGTYPEVTSVVLEVGQHSVKVLARVKGWDGSYRVRVYYRPRIPAETWRGLDMHCSGGVCEAEILLEFPVALYVAVEDREGVVYSASRVYVTGGVTPAQLAPLAVVLTVLAVSLLGFVRYRVDDLLTLLAVAASTYPFIARAVFAVRRGFSISPFELIERYIVLLDLNEAVTYVIAAAVALAVTAVLVSRHVAALLVYSTASLLYTTYIPRVVASVFGSAAVEIVPDPASFVAAVVGVMMSVLCLVRHVINNLLLTSSPRR